MSKILKGTFVITSSDYPDEKHKVVASLTDYDVTLAVEHEVDIEDDYAFLDWALMVAEAGELEGTCVIGKNKIDFIGYEGYLLK